MINLIRLSLLLILMAPISLVPMLALAAPQCEDIFTSPPTGNHIPGLVPPTDIGPSLGNLTCTKQNGCTPNASFTAGDYNFQAASFNGGDYITTNGATTRLYFNSLTMSNSTLNANGNAEDLIIFVRGSVSIAGQNTLNAIVYVAGAVQISGQATINGALAAGGGLVIQGNGSVNIDAHALDDTDYGGMCESSAAILLQCPAGQDSVQGVTYRTYDSRAWSTSNTSPVDHNAFDVLLATVRNTLAQIGESIEPDINQRGFNINPHSNAPADQELYLGVFEGYLDVPENGEYIFAVDGDDAIELLINDQPIVGYYGLHGSCNCTSHQGRVTLAKGTHKLELRFHEAMGEEAYRLYWQTPTQSSLTIIPETNYLTCPFPQFEFGKVSLDDSGEANISFSNTYAQPPVVILMSTINGIDGSNANADGPSSVEISALTQVSVSISQDYPPSSRTAAKDMTDIDYFVMEPGYLWLERGKALQAGLVSTDKYQGKRLPSSGRGYDTVDFGHDFGATPAMVAQATTRNNGRFITSVINNVKDDEFQIAIEANEISSSITQAETYGYAAGLGRGAMVLNGISVLYEFALATNHNAGNRTRNLSQQCNYFNTYGNTYLVEPIVVAKKNTRRGADGGWVRRCLTDTFNNRVSFVIDEDQQGDRERNHLAEAIGYFAFERGPDVAIIDHYRIAFSSSALSCVEKEVTISACIDDQCTEYQEPASIALTLDDEVYSNVSFTGNTSTEVSHLAGGTVLLGLDADVPGASNAYRCYIDGIQVDNDNCELDFAATGFYFDVPNTTSCHASSDFSIFAVTKNSQTQQCQPLFQNQTKSIDFSLTYIAPNAVNVAAKLSLSSLNSPSDNVEVGGASVSLDIAFDSLGIGTLTANYTEAGVVELAASYAHSVTLPDGSSETLLLSHKDNFTAAPAGFHFFNDSGINGCKSPACAMFSKAGEDFNLNVKAVCWQDGATDFSTGATLHNFEYRGLTIKPILMAPLSANGDAQDGSLGVLGLNSLSFMLNNNAPHQMTDQAYSEVGAIAFALDDDVHYENVTIAKENASSELFGRFTPFYLDVTGNEPKLAPACGSFTYMDQAFGFLTGVEPILTVKGYNKEESLTTNYQIGDWWRYGAGQTWPSRSYSASEGTIWDYDSPALSGSILLNSSVSTASLISAQLKYLRTAIPVAPFDTNFDLLLSITDVSDSDGVCYQATAAGACQDFTFKDIQHGMNGEAIALRYGRMQLENGYGPQTEAIRIPLRTEYVSTLSAGNPVWLTNVDDNCSVYNTLTSTDSSNVPTTGLYMDFPSGFPEIMAYSNEALSLRDGLVSAGAGYLYLSPANTAGELPLLLHVQPWLKGYWNYAGDKPNELYDPRASALFGTYRGHDKVIYWREVNNE